MENLNEHTPEAKNEAFKKDVDAIIKRIEGEVDVNTFSLTTLPNGTRLLRLKYDLTQYCKDEISAAFNRRFPGGQISENFEL